MCCLGVAQAGQTLRKFRNTRFDAVERRRELLGYVIAQHFRFVFHPGDAVLHFAQGRRVSAVGVGKLRCDRIQNDFEIVVFASRLA